MEQVISIPLQSGFRGRGVGGGYQGKPLGPTVDLLVADEISMVDVMLMQSLLKAVSDTAAVLIVGVTLTSYPRSGRGRSLPTSSSPAQCPWSG